MSDQRVSAATAAPNTSVCVSPSAWVTAVHIRATLWRGVSVTAVREWGAWFVQTPYELRLRRVGKNLGETTFRRPGRIGVQAMTA